MAKNKVKIFWFIFFLWALVISVHSAKAQQVNWQSYDLYRIFKQDSTNGGGSSGGVGLLDTTINISAWARKSLDSLHNISKSGNLSYQTLVSLNSNFANLYGATRLIANPYFSIGSDVQAVVNISDTTFKPSLDTIYFTAVTYSFYITDIVINYSGLNTVGSAGISTINITDVNSSNVYNATVYIGGATYATSLQTETLQTFSQNFKTPVQILATHKIKLLIKTGAATNVHSMSIKGYYGYF